MGGLAVSSCGPAARDRRGLRQPSCRLRLVRSKAVAGAPALHGAFGTPLHQNNRILSVRNFLGLFLNSVRKSRKVFELSLKLL